MKSAQGKWIGSALILLIAILAASNTRAQRIEDIYQPVPNGTVFALALQPDGRLIVGGAFTEITLLPQPRLARLHGDGSMDAGFLPVIGNGSVRTVAVQADAKIVAGGTFTSVGIGGSAAVERIARFVPDGSPDPGFSATVNSTVNALAVQADGRIVIGGTFTEVNGVPRARIARLMPDGSLDTSFDPGADRTVRTLALQADGKILVGGRFLTIADVAHVSIARLHQDGSLDADFIAEANGPINAIEFAADGGIYIGGEFSQVSGVARSRLARLESDGSLNTDFDIAANGKVWALHRVPSGSLLVGGEFTALDGDTDAGYFGRILVDPFDGQFGHETDLDVGILGDNPVVRALVAQPDGKILPGGRYARLNGSLAHRNLGRLYPHDGRVESTFQGSGSPDGTVRTVAIAADNGVLIGGDFTLVDAEPRAHVALLTAQGTLVDTFVADTNGQVNALAASTLYAVVVVGGSYTSINGQARTSLARVSPLDGVVSGDFAPVLGNGFQDPIVHALAMPIGGLGGLVVAGEFTSVNGVARGNIARILLANGDLDADFDPVVDGPVFAVAIDHAGRTVIGGDFTTVDGQSRLRIARLLADGSLDPDFAPHADGPVLALAASPDGPIWVGGAFTAIAGQSRNHLALLDADGNDSGIDPAPNDEVYSLALYADGRVLVGGHFSQIGGASRTLVARLTPDGLVDPTFSLPVDTNGNGSVLALALQSDGKAILGGDFTDVNHAPYAKNLARLSEEQPALQRLSLEDRQLHWRRSGSAPALVWLPLAISYSLAVPDTHDRGSIAFFPLYRDDGHWASLPLDLPAARHVRMSATGGTTGGLHGGSTGSVVSERLFYRPEAIFADGFDPP